MPPKKVQPPDLKKYAGHHARGWTTRARPDERAGRPAARRAARGARRGETDRRHARAPTRAADAAVAPTGTSTSASA